VFFLLETARVQKSIQYNILNNIVHISKDIIAEISEGLCVGSIVSQLGKAGSSKTCLEPMASDELLMLSAGQ
jgi:hypothetical protein